MNEASEGNVIGKREAFVMPGDDAWEHVFEINQIRTQLERYRKLLEASAVRAERSGTPQLRAQRQLNYGIHRSQ
jgi:hypothetical protein